MKTYATLPLVLVTSLCSPVHADERFLPYIKWLTENSDFVYNSEELPTIVTMPYTVLEVEVYGPEQVAQSELNGTELPTIKGAFDHRDNRMMFPEGIDVWAMEDTITHELVHFLQMVNGTMDECIPANEREAYELHWEWVKAHGREADFEEPNWLFVFMLDMACREEYWYR